MSDFEFKQYTYSDEFIKTVNTFLSYQKKIDKVSKSVNAIKEKRDSLKEEILVYMEENGIPSVPLANGRAIYYSNEKKTRGLSNKLAFDRIKEFYKDDPAGQRKLITFIKDPNAREKVEKRDIKIK